MTDGAPGVVTFGEKDVVFPKAQSYTVQICQEIGNVDNFGANYRVLFSGIL